MTHAFPTRRSSDLQGQLAKCRKRNPGQCPRSLRNSMPAPCGPLWTPVSGASLSPGKGAQGCSRSRTCSDKRPSADIGPTLRSEEHTSELQSLMRISYAVFCLKKKKTTYKNN